MGTITTRNPATGESLATYKLHSDEEVRTAIAYADQAFKDWRKSTFNMRSKLMRSAAEVLKRNKERYARTITLEMGKTLSSAIAEVEKCAWVCDYYAEHAASFLSDEMVDTDAFRSLVAYQPLGVILAVMPWNYPFWQVFRFAAPALMAGNAGILKHASNVPGCALYIQEVFEEAGFPTNLFKSLLIKSDQVEGILSNPKVKAATLTGSGPAGSAVASLAGQHIKKTVLELGGSDPYLILEDADLDLAAAQCAAGRLLNAGQSCIGAKRFIAVDAIYEEFLASFTKKMSDATMGDPMTDVTIGPMAREDLRAEIHGQVEKSIEKGAELILGGSMPDGKGVYYPPTILVNVTPGMPAYGEEIFGPVASVIRAQDESDAIRIANDTDFGLGACVFTRDLERGERIAREELDAGCCFVNAFVKSDPRLPFGGVKTSGYGRELSHFGIQEFVNIKTIYIK